MKRRARKGSPAQTVYDRTSFPARYWLGCAGALDGVGQADSFEHPDEVPADIGLIPAKAKARGTCMRVMILVPVLTPSRQLEWAKPPDIHAGIAFFDMVEVREAVHQALHVQ